MDRRRKGQRGAGQRVRDVATTPEARLWQYTDQHGPVSRAFGTPCWPWTGPRDSGGHPIMRLAPWARSARALLWRAVYGADVPRGQHVFRLCETDGCVRPHHGELRALHATARAERDTTNGAPLHAARKLSPVARRAIRARVARGASVRRVAALFEVSRATVALIVADPQLKGR